MYTGMQIDTALDMLLHDGRATHEAAGKILGVVPAIVIAVHDTKGPKRHMMGMIQVYFPWLQAKDDPNLIAPWARVSFMNAGKGTGFYSLHQIGDEVIVAFEQGDPHHPYVIGAMWNGKNTIPLPVTDMDGDDCPGNHPGNPVHKTPDLTPTSIGGDKGKNKTYFWRSRTGNLIILDDDKGTTRILERTGNSVIQQQNDRIEVLSKKGDLFVYAKKTIRFDSTTWEVHASKNIRHEAGGDWHSKSDRHTTAEIKQTFSAKADMKLLINSKKDMNVHCGNGINIKANLALQVKSGEKDQKFEAGANFTSSSMMDTSIASQKVVNLKASSMINMSTLMELNVQAGSDVNAKAGMIHMN